MYAPSLPGLPQPRSLASMWRYAGFIKPATPPDEETAKCPESLARCRCYRQRGDVYRLLREHYFSVIALTDSCAKPIWLSLPSAFSLVLGVSAGCYRPLLPVGSSPRYSENLS